MLGLKQQYAGLADEMRQALDEVLKTQHFIGGPFVKELEEKVASYCDCTAAVGVSSGTDALLCTLMALEIGTGDEVITTPYSFFATASCISRLGACPVFVDIEPDTFNIDASMVEAAVTERTRAILPVHIFGQVADMDDLLEVARRHDLYVVEDAAQAIGATYRGKKAGSLGAAGCFSFYPSKNLGGLGDGGMITTNDAGLAEKLAIFRNHGSHPKYYHRWIGGNFRLDALQAAGLLVKLPYLEGWHEDRRRIAGRYDALLSELAEVVTPVVRPENVSIFNQYAIRTARRDELRAHLAERGVGTEIYYPLSLHEQECFRDLGYQRGDFPESERAAAESLAIPLYPELTEEQVEYVAGQVREFFSLAGP
jgi:dTDP-4-amino-4,6-dideoxygalactose transaminase